MPSDERTPLLWSHDEDQERHHPPATHPGQLGHEDNHAQFCALVGVPPSASTFNLTSKDAKAAAIKHQIYKNSLYGKASAQLSSQRRAYNFSASLNNTLLLFQVILGATLTGLGASASSPLLVTIFGATNTIIAGLVAYLKSRGQPMRARMYRDDLQRVVDEIENSEVMWRGISEGVHGYDDIDTESQVTVRSEVARLTRLYDRAVRNNTMNNPDMYMAGGGVDAGASGLRNRGLPGQQGPVPVSVALPAVPPAAGVVGDGGAAGAVPAVPAPSAPAADPDQSPATAPPQPKDDDDKKEADKTDKNDGDDKKEDKGKEPESSASSSSPSQPSAPAPAPAPTPAPPQTLISDPDASPASAPILHRRSTKDDAPKKVKGEDE